jgi:predicted HD phosphohydrolase
VWRSLLDGLAGLPYGGEAVDQLAHARQCAAAAVTAGADDALVVAAALHDIGRARPVMALHPGVPHEEAGARFCEPHLGERVAWLIRAHVPAKRYLVAIELEYFDGLSPASVGSLARQGGPMSAAEVAAFHSMPWAEDAVALRRWDDAAKNPAGDGPSAAALAALVERLCS